MTSKVEPQHGGSVSPTQERPLPRSLRLVIVLAGIVLGQIVLYGPSLTGKKVLLPVDILAAPNIFIPRTPGIATIRPHNSTQADLVFQCEPRRLFGVGELHAGRFPVWTPYEFGGTPFFWPKFSPFFLLQCSTASPIVLAWTQMLQAIVCGLGAYMFFRRALSLGFWPASLAAWCYPLTAFFVLWQGAPPCQSVYWLPWILLAVDGTVRQPRRVAPIGLSVATGMVLVSGQLDGAAQVLLVSGCYGVWCWLDEYPGRWLHAAGQAQGEVDGGGAGIVCSAWRMLEFMGMRGQGRSRPAPTLHDWGLARKRGLMLAAGWGLGFLLAAPAFLPAFYYAQTGARLSRRSAGSEERPPIGLAALPQVVLPRMYGSSEQGSLPVGPKNQGNLQESSAATYTGLLATLFAAPLAFCSRRHLSGNLFWALLACFALSWSLNLPGFVQLLRLPGLNLMSHNRLVFAASFAILSLAAIGLDLLWQGRFRWRWWFWLPLAVLAGLGGWCAYRATILPEPIRTELASGLAQGRQSEWVGNLQDVHVIQAWFSRGYWIAALLCGIAIAGWLCLWRRSHVRPWFVVLVGLLCAGDLLGFGFGRSAQCDPALYFPRVPVLDQLAKSPPGRMIGYNCLPALLGVPVGLRDIRGYDGVDPARMIDLLTIGREPKSPAPDYSFAQGLIPKGGGTPEGGIGLTPVFDLLNVRYVVFRGTPDPTDRPLLQGPDYFVLLNRSALPRTFVPRRVELVADDKTRLEKLALPDFDPRNVAYVESAVDLPVSCLGSAEIAEEIPTRINVVLRMETAGLVILTDLWDKGWRAYLDDKRVPILRTNHALRGVVAPAGSRMLEFRYEPTSFAWGLGLAGGAAVILLGWVAAGVWWRRGGL